MTSLGGGRDEKRDEGGGGGRTLLGGGVLDVSTRSATVLWGSRRERSCWCCVCVRVPVAYVCETRREIAGEGDRNRESRRKGGREERQENDSDRGK